MLNLIIFLFFLLLKRNTMSHFFKNNIKGIQCLEIFIIATGIATALTNVFAADQPAVKFPPSILFVIGGLLWYIFFVDFQSLKQVLTQFRGLVIASTLIIINFCDIIRPILSHHKTHSWTIVILDLCTWSTAIIILLSLDSVQNVSNWMRFSAPFAAVANGIHNLFDITEDDNPSLFTIKYGSITVNQMELAATVELIIFLFTLMFRVPLDWNHEYYSILNKKIQRKELLPLKDYGRDITQVGCCKFKTRYLYWFIGIIGCIMTILDISGIENDYADAPMAIILCASISILIYKHFEWKIFKRLINKFRSFTLGLSIMTKIYIPIQRIIWNDHEYSVINRICFSLVYNMGVILLWTRDGMLVTYSLVFSWIIAISLFAVSVYNVLDITFFVKQREPSWFILLDKEGYYQVAVFSLLTMRYLIYDKQFKYFVLIRDAAERNQRNVRNHNDTQVSLDGAKTDYVELESHKADLDTEFNS